MAEKYKPAEDKNWQQRQYDSYGPHFRIETADPRPGMCGPIVYNLYGYTDDGNKNTSNLGMKGDGQFELLNDRCITIAGGYKNNGDPAVNIFGLGGSVNITAENGKLTIKSSTDVLINSVGGNIDLVAAGQVNVKAQEFNVNDGIQKINMNASNVNITGKGKIRVKDVSWMDQCIAGTTITETGIAAYEKNRIKNRGAGFR